MSKEEAIEYIHKLNFCAGCSTDFGNKNPNESERICNECEHRRFFEFVKNLILKDEQDRIFAKEFDDLKKHDTKVQADAIERFAIWCENNSIDFSASCSSEIIEMFNSDMKNGYQIELNK